MTIRSVAIVGAQGRMGRLFAELCQRAGQSVLGLDQPLPEALAAAAGDFRRVDLVFLAVPINVVDPVLAAIAPYMESQVLADMCSVKEDPMERMLAAYSGPVVGTHPLFGPEPSPDQTRVAVCPGRGTEACQAVSRWLADLGLQPFDSTAGQHDRAMAFLQGLNFVTHAAYLSAAAEVEDIESYLTPSFGRRLEAARKMLTQDSELFEILFEYNPHSQEAVRLFRSHLNLAASGDVDLLTQRAGQWFPAFKTRENPS